MTSRADPSVSSAGYGLLELLTLERIEDNFFRAAALRSEPVGLYGGQVAAQALRAAFATVPAGRHPHSCHGYFLSRGDASRPVLLIVHRDRDGGSYSNRRVIAHYDRSGDALAFANSHWAADLCRMGTSCPDHFLRTRICPMFVPWNPAGEDVETLQRRVADQLVRYREEYAQYYRSCAQPGSPALRDSNPSVVVIPALGVFGFGKDKREARITTEFFLNAVHVILGGEGGSDTEGRSRARWSGPGSWPTTDGSPTFARPIQGGGSAPPSCRRSSTSMMSWGS